MARVGESEGKKYYTYEKNIDYWRSKNIRLEKEALN